MALSDEVKKGLEKKVEDHNEEISKLNLSWNGKVTLKKLEVVFERGIGAYKTNPSSVRPNVKSPEQWAYARVNSFLYAMKKGKFRSGKHDTDLLPKDHPIRKEMDKRALSDIDTKPTQSMAQEAELGLKWREEFGRGGTSVGVARARDLKNRKDLSIQTIKRMFSFFSRHEVDKKAEGFRKGEKGYPSNGRIAWALWGGDPGFSWSKKKRKEIEKQENRSVMNIEKRNFVLDELEIRELDNNEKKIIGYAAVFGSLSNDLGNFRELIDPNAFDGRTDDDVRFLINHDANLILGRTLSGTLSLSIDEKGLRYEATIPDTQAGRDLIVSMNRGDITQSSFAFTVEKDEWSQDNETMIRTIKKVSRLYDVSAVTYPAYEEADVALRSLEKWKLNESFEKEKIENQKEEKDLIQRNLAEMRLKINKLKF